MAVTPVRPAMPSFDHRSQAPVEPVAPAAQVQPVDSEHGRAAGGGHGHGHGQQHHAHLHLPAHGPTPRPRRNASAKTSRSRRRRRAGAPVEDDEIELPEAEHLGDGVAGVGFQDEHPDGGNDHDEGERERSRHERLGRVRQHQAEQAQAMASDPQAARPGAGAGHALDAFVSASCSLVAAWRPGERVVQAMQQAKLQLLQSGHEAARFDGGGLARVAELLRDRMPERSGPGSPALNMMLPMLVLQMQLARTPDQLDEAIARVRVGVRGVR